MIPILISFIAPALIILLCQRIRILDKVGVVVLTFGAGMAAAMLLDLDALYGGNDLTKMQTSLSEVCVALALPLLLFSMNFKKSISMAKDTLYAMSMALVSIVIMSLAGAVIFQNQVQEIWQVAGMSVGVYTGGGPNMAAIKTAIDADETIFLAMISYDVLMSTLYLIFVMTIGQRFFGLFLKPYVFKDEEGKVDISEYEHLADESANSYKVLVDPKKILDSVKAILASGIILGAAVFASKLLPDDMSATFIIVSITTLGLVASLFSSIHSLRNSFPLGMYLILVFCFTIGTLFDIEMLLDLDFGLVYYILFIIGGSLALQAFLCKLRSIDRDTFLITSSAAIMSVPFIAVISGSLKNKEVMLPGFAAAILGYGIGNYLGIMVANVTRWLVG